MSSGKTVLTLLAGVGAGVAIGYWLASEKNDKLRKKIAKALNTMSDEFQQKLMDEFSDIKDKASSIKDKGVSLKEKIILAIKDLKDDTKQRVLDYIEKAGSEVNGVKKEAKQTMQ